MKLLFLTCALFALLFSAIEIRAEDMEVEESTESPIADMALLDPKDDHMMKADKQKMPAEAQPHTIADFIIHPLIALKPRPVDVQPNAEGKQADTSTTTPAPWQLFGFNTGQGLGIGSSVSSSVSSLAESVSGWLGNRIQLPGLVDTPVREPSTTSTTTTTTIRPDVVVRVQQRQTTRKPLISINNNRPNNNNNNNNNRRKNQNNNNIDDSEEFDDDFDDDFDDFEDDSNNNNRDHDDDDESSNEDDDDEYNDEEEHEDEDEEEENEEPVKQQNNNRRRRPANSNNNNNNNQRRRAQNNNFNNQGNRSQQNRRRPQESQEVEEYEYYDDSDNDNENDDASDENDQQFYYNNNQKRSQTPQGFIQRGQQSLMDQIRQLTRGQNPAEIGTAMRKPSGNNKKRRQQATLIINRNGQTIYVAPELLQAVEQPNKKVKPSTQQYQYYQPAVPFDATNQNKRPGVSAVYPQPPLTVPYRTKGKPTQYITIPWSQLGISPPNNLVSITEGIQSQPLILNIPQSAINALESQSQRPNNKRKQVITPEAVPLLAEASLMDIFKPPRIPPARSPPGIKPSKKISGSPVIIASKPKPGAQRIRPGTIVEKAPASDEQSADSESAQYIVVGDDGELGLGRNAFPYYSYAQRGGRQLNAEETAKTEQQIHVQVITEDEPMKETKVESVEEAKVESSPEVKTAEPAVEMKVEDTNVEAPVVTPDEAVIISAKVDDAPDTVDLSSIAA